MDHNIYYQFIIYITNSQYILPMGKETSKIKDIIYVDANDFSKMKEYKAQKKQKREVDVKYKHYKPKKYYREDVTDEQLSRHLLLLQKKQSILKRFRYNEDFDRIDYKEVEQQRPIIENQIQNDIFFILAGSIPLSRLLGVQYYQEYLTMANWFRMYWKCVFLTLPLVVVKTLLSQEYHIVNHDYFRLHDETVSMRQQNEVDLDLYRDIDDIKFNYKYPSLQKFYDLRKEKNYGNLEANRGRYQDYWQYLEGVKLDKIQQFVKEREQQRKERKSDKQSFPQFERQSVFTDINGLK